MNHYEIRNGRITFYCPQDFFSKAPKTVGIRGTFTAWRADSNFLLTQIDKTWTLTKALEQVLVPGNSGLPEFIFYAEFDDGTKETSLPDPRKGFHFLGNTVIMYDKTVSPNSVSKNEETALEVRALSSFNLQDEKDRHILANMRPVPGTTKLWRGYHPYKKSRPQFDSEDERLNMVNTLLEEHGIKSVITLSGDEECDPSLGEKISPYMQNIRSSWNQMITDTTYETVYFNSGSKEFAQLIASIVKFINSHPCPYYIHCRLGSDRTGTTSATLASLCGASWTDIARDYEKTSLMGIQEFRDSRLLAYCFNNMLNQEKKSNLKSAVSAHLVNSGCLTQDEINEVVKRLQS